MKFNNIKIHLKYFESVCRNVRNFAYPVKKLKTSLYTKINIIRRTMT